MLLIQSVQLTWKLNLLPTCRSGTPFCRGLLLSTNYFVVVWRFHQVGERAGIHSVHSVVEDAVEQNSWGKSGSDWMCRFQNNGGLHRTSGDAPLKHMTLGGELESTPYWPMILYARRMVRRGQSYAVDSKRSIDLKTQFVAHVLIRYTILPKPPFTNKWFCGLWR